MFQSFEIVLDEIKFSKTTVVKMCGVICYATVQRNSKSSTKGQHPMEKENKSESSTNKLNNRFGQNYLVFLGIKRDIY